MSSPSPVSDAPPARGLRDPRWYILPGAFLLYLLRFGYDYGTSDQDEVIPYLLHLIDPGLFVSDWFVQAQVADFNVRTVFVWLLRGPAEVLPVWLTVLVAYVAFWMLLAGAVWALAERLTGDRVAAALSVVLVLVATPQWTLGGNDLAHSMLVPSMAGWALALWGTWWALRERWIVAGVVLGTATWMQALVGLQMAGIVGIWLLVRTWRTRNAPRERPAWRAVALFTTAMVLTASPVLIPIIQGQTITPSPSTASPSLFYILAQFRLPHHYLPSAFPLASYFKFGGIVLLGILGLAWSHRRGLLAHGSFTATALATILGLILIGSLFTEVTPWLFVAKLQLFKATVFAKVLCLIGLCGAVAYGLPGMLRRLADWTLRAGRIGSALVLLLWAVLIGALIWPSSPLYHLNRPAVRLESDQGALMLWARQHTAADAQFAVPPSWSSFRTYAHRNVVVNFKAIPYREPLIREWYGRITTWAPVDPPPRATRDLQQRLDSAYAALPAPALVQRADAYAVDYVIRPSEATPLPPSFKAVRSTSAGIVYRVPSSLAPPVQ